MQFALIQKSGLTDDQTTTIYTNSTTFNSVVISGTFSYTGTDISEAIYVNLKLRTINSDSSITESFIFNNIPMIYGSSIVIPKICLLPNSSLIAFTDSPGSGKIDVTGSVLELAGIYPENIVTP